MKTQFVLFVAGSLGMAADALGQSSIHLWNLQRNLLRKYFYIAPAERAAHAQRTN